ncbi:GntP family permease [Clostridium sp. C8]|uniref:D-serine transporter DsdX n=1 Tax=bioreactor metagenome TaxID=1076179 RepID=A0A644WLS5_9ZZZZ|nr:GntP family permease [Clostridium sp. C8]KLE14257.1 gluconate:proton symporter [Clostridium sp. C8]
MDVISVSALGAIVALIISITLIIKKIHPAYALILGALIGGLVGGVSLVNTVNFMMDGAKGMITAILRILTAGVLAGVLIESGAAIKIAETIVSKIGQQRALIALAIATMLLTMVGVFIDVAVITVSPIAIAIAKKANLSKPAILLAMIGGGKAGNLMSPNPNAIVASENLQVPLTSLMIAGIIPAIFGVIVTCMLAKWIDKKGVKIQNIEGEEKESKELPSFIAAISGPIITIILLMLRPIAGIVIDPLIALPVGGIIGAIIMGKGKQISNYAVVGLNKMSGVAILLLGTGTLAGIISNSQLKDLIINGVDKVGLPSILLAPIAGILMSAATASTTSGTAVGTSVFGPTILELGIPGLNAAAMIHSGATVLDHLPHGSFFHATGGSVGMEIKERLKLIPYESLIGLVMTIVSTIVFGVIL